MSREIRKINYTYDGGYGYTETHTLYEVNYHSSGTRRVIDEYGNELYSEDAFEQEVTNALIDLAKVGGESVSDDEVPEKVLKTVNFE